MGSPTYGETIVKRTLDILATHTPKPLPEAACRAIDEIARQAEQSLSGHMFSV